MGNPLIGHKVSPSALTALSKLVFAHSILPAPDFTIPTSDGTEFTLSSIVGKGVPVALFFFPEAGTSVCDAESCAFEATFPTIEENPKLHIVGVTYQSPSVLAEWKVKNKIHFTVLSDEKKVAKEAYKVGRALFGKFEGRSTFYINKDGKVEGVCDGTVAFLSAKKHVDFIKSYADK